MIHLLQSLRTGTTEAADVPVPKVTPESIVVETAASVISAGTERMVVEFGRSGWLAKARSQPDKVRQVLEKARTDGVAASLEAVRAKLDAPMPLGYCQAGTVRDVGRTVSGFAIGDRVATNGPHAEFVRVAPTLAARIPDGVSFEAAAFAPLAAIGLQGLRLAAPTLGETVVVYGLGLVGLLTVQLARSAGCKVIGIDRAAARCALAERFGAETVHADGDVDVAGSVRRLTDDVGADVVLLTLATDSDEPVHIAAEMSRKRGRIVLVGVAGLRLRREDFFRKELTFQVSCSYGPGRYDPAHEELGIDYPLAYVRWTEGRNFAAVLELMADGRLDPLPLITHRFAIGDAALAYDVIAGGSDSLGVVLSYSGKTGPEHSDGWSVELRAPVVRAGAGVVGVIGAGNFAARLLIPALKSGGARLAVLASSGGVSAAVIGRQTGFSRVTSDPGSVLGDPSIDTIVVATRHDTHAAWAIRALATGKHVFVEKPLALTLAELDDVEAAARQSSGMLCVGFNRRFAPHVQAAMRQLAGRVGPLVISITVNAGAIAKSHWTQDPEIGGGRIVGEACHFIDLCRFLTGAEMTAAQVLSARSRAAVVEEDVTVLQFSFADGSLATVQYLANGSREYPKERIELFFDGKTIRLDNFRKVRSWGTDSIGGQWPARQDKGHKELAARFIASVREGGPSPIALDELLEVSAVAIETAQLARQGGGALMLAGGRNTEGE